ncbi:MAG TPA: hypothetical protein CFH84_09150 [Sulfurimonas sp. UBA12504]|nr:MAG: hypothetical protein A2019_04860 [Sulfurimonas sp. GWF2_37_8]DAB29498.1 MAG TPA: hypothetical protein CFH84_09150 [Sulfurimonas sp. UBA12504]
MDGILPTTADFETLTHRAALYLRDILHLVFLHSQKENAIVVYDRTSLLSRILEQAYREVLPHALFIDFNTLPPLEIRKILDALEALDFVALIQSTNFRLDAFRIRVELFKRNIKVIEHPHLGRMSDEEASYYIDSLAYDSVYYRGVGRALKAKIDSVSSGIIDSGGEFLLYNSPFESAKVNIGDYTGMTNMGGQFPLGEVFTEAQDLRAVHGRLKIFCFGDVTYKINTPQIPIILIIEKGQVVACENATPEFEHILSLIRRDEGGIVLIRELGFGLNRAFSKTRTVADTGTYERMCGVHVSLGAKHGTYGKPGFKRGDGLYHVDVFVDTHTVILGNEVVFKEGSYII